ncbi:unnamed protein product [Brachionus calyciflorus]|uniref:Peptidase M14 domain-containing protein n=1 Tax=Brachionus calyciflorus TaxID=104777 RepID=A0A814JK37_9BILA|nr:unnamed protein product [Brachionus calyciflorus]
MFLKSFILIAFLAIGYGSCEKVSFEGFKIVRIFPTDKSHLELIGQLQHNPDFDVLNSARILETPILVVLSPEALVKYSPIFSTNKVEFRVIDNNIQRKFDLQDKSMKKNKRDAKNIVGKFSRYSEINNYIDEVVAASPNIASSYVAGTTHENRIIKALVFKTATSNRGIFIDCGLHAREWIAVSSCIWMIDSMQKAFENGDASMQAILSKYEIHIIPLANPDGYEYSHTTNRMWRKNRRPNSGSSCIGTDLNRNFGYKWLTGGSSTNPCSDSYAGPSGDSELETKAIEKAILNKNGYWDAYLTIHTYGQYWLTSWSYTTDLPADYDDLKLAVDIGAAAIKNLFGNKKL